MIEVRNLHKSFGKKNVLNGVDFDINDGDTMCIIGKSGCGKSVLLKNIVGLLEPDEGYVKVDGKIISELEQDELFQLRTNMGFVFQGSALFDSYTVFENIILRQYEHGIRDLKLLEDEAQKVLSAVGLLPDYAEKDSENFRKEWAILKDKKPADLSGGMKKRVGVARALVGSPKYIFYDEPTTGLDPVTSIQIDRLIADLADRFNVTSIVITHDLFSVYEVADHVIMLNDGRVQFRGTPQELKESDDKIVNEFLDRYEKCVM
jgi:phospholipid/cholesterol/gamma-HCH transport system ATP-binding protein